MNVFNELITIGSLLKYIHQHPNLGKNGFLNWFPKFQLTKSMISYNDKSYIDKCAHFGFILSKCTWLMLLGYNSACTFQNADDTAHTARGLLGVRSTYYSHNGTQVYTVLPQTSGERA